MSASVDLAERKHAGKCRSTTGRLSSPHRDFKHSHRLAREMGFSRVSIFRFTATNEREEMRRAPRNGTRSQALNDRCTPGEDKLGPSVKQPFRPILRNGRQSWGAGPG